MASEQGKKLFKSIYNEDPVQFKKDFNDSVKSKIMNKIEDMKKDIINKVENPVEEKDNDKE